MASDKGSLLKQRLRRGSDSFRFDALIEGVSTLEETVTGETVLVTDEESISVDYVVELTQSMVEGEPATQPALVVLEPETPPAAAVDTESQRLRWALTELSRRFTSEITQFSSALQSGDVESAGQHLAQVNQALELLQPLDPHGDVSRSLSIPGAPPTGQTWPAPAWSFVEFAESPLSGLLPSGADEPFVRDVLYSAWGIPA